MCCTAKRSKKGWRGEQHDLCANVTERQRGRHRPNRPRAGKRDVWLVFWIVPAFYTAFGVIFFALARVMPPPRPDVTTDQMVHFFHAHALTIKIGFGILVLIVGRRRDGPTASSSIT